MTHARNSEGEIIYGAWSYGSEGLVCIECAWAIDVEEDRVRIEELSVFDHPFRKSLAGRHFCFAQSVDIHMLTLLSWLAQSYSELSGHLPCHSRTFSM